MNVQRAKEIYDSEHTIPVKLDNGESVWIEKVDMDNGVATVQVGTTPLNTQTVAVDRLSEG